MGSSAHPRPTMLHLRYDCCHVHLPSTPHSCRNAAPGPRARPHRSRCLGPGLRRRSPEPTREHPPRGSRRSRPTQRLVGGGFGACRGARGARCPHRLQETKIAASAQSIETAEAEAAQAQTEADILAGEIEAIRDRLRRRAVDAYVAPATDALDQLNSDDLIGSASGASTSTTSLATSTRSSINSEEPSPNRRR